MWPETNHPRRKPSVPPRPTRIPERPTHPDTRSSTPAHQETPAPTAKIQPDKPANKTVEINISLPKIPKIAPLANLKNKLPHIPRKYLIVGCIVVILGVAGWFVGSYTLRQHTIIVNGGSSDAPAVAATNIAGKPDYPTVLPAGKNIDSLGGWTRVSPADKNPVFAYADTIAGTPINVSQQPLPKEFKQNPADAIERLAKAYQATVKVTAGSVTAYIGTSAKGPQSVIFTTNDLLVLIKSTAKIDAAKWGEYISSLK